MCHSRELGLESNGRWARKKPSLSDAKIGLPQICSDLPVVGGIGGGGEGAGGRKDSVKPGTRPSWGSTWLSQLRKFSVFRGKGAGRVHASLSPK